MTVGFRVAIRLIGFSLATAAMPAPAEVAVDSGGPPFGTLTASARLDFILNIGKFLFFRIGTGAYPTASSTIDQVTFTLVPSIPAGPTTPSFTLNNAVVNWSGSIPSFVASSSSNVLPVEVRSNAGQVTIRATVSSPLASGLNTIPMSEISIASSDANLPGPTIPNSGTGPTVNVTGTAFSNLVTIRSANWTFAYSPVTVPSPGTYSGQLSFTASAP